MSTSSRKVSTSSLVNSLAKRFDPNALQHQGPTTTTEEMILSPPVQKEDSALEGPNDMHQKFDFLSLKLDQLLTVQDNVIQKLDSISQEVEGMGKDMVMGRMEKAGPEPTCKMKEDVLETKELCLEMNRALSQINNSAEQQARRLDGVEQIVLGIQQFISFLAEKLKTSKIGELLLKRRVAPSVQPGKDGRNLKNEKAKGFGRVRASSGKKDALLNKRKQKVTRDHKVKEKKEKPNVGLKGTKSLKKKKPPDSEVECPVPAAPFDHRIVSAKHAQISNYFTVNRSEIIGGGRFGQVHMCTEKTSGLTLAAKIIKAKFLKQKEEVKNEIYVMNQLNHSNLIQLYDAFESKNDIVLVMEYVPGGELFDRIIDESYRLTELDTILFIKQICEGIQYMHQMYIIHLDLKPENILCVNRGTNQIKIIDFGLARRYKPREKLKVHFGTPEFLAPEVVNYDFVSFPTDMWSIGVIAYMLLSGLSPFMGEDDNETMNNIISCQWSFENEEFQDVSDDAKDFITKLLIKDKSWRISASESLKHSWIANAELHCKLSLQRKMKSSTVSQAPVKQ